MTTFAITTVLKNKQISVHDISPTEAIQKFLKEIMDCKIDISLIEATEIEIRERFIP